MDSKAKKRTTTPKTSILGVGDALGSGDSYLVTNMLPPELADVAFENMKAEVQWNTMHHKGGEVPRLVAMEGEIAEDGSFPVYRFPSDEFPAISPFSSTVSLIREHVQQVLQHPVNHVLIQFYRNGKDAISEHSDKTIDVVRGSNIVNVSLGAQRTMILRLKKDKMPLSTVSGTTGNDNDSVTASGPSVISEGVVAHESVPAFGVPRTTQRIPLPHNSMFVMGLETNTKWVHGINPDNRPSKIKSPEEQIEDGGRISLTFRHIGTFLSKDKSMIWGQGAKGKTKDQARKVIYDQEDALKLIRQFGNENQQNNFDWDAAYGQGYDVLNFGVAG